MRTCAATIARGRGRRNTTPVAELAADVVVLYVDPLGVYPRLAAHWYDETRDARTYAGALPVVAHPPCGPWGRLRHLSRRDDPAHALAAVEAVRRLGGVLEHPRGSLLWQAAGLPLPGAPADAWGGWSVKVDQCDFGHVARKSTWLYIVGTRALPPIPPPREPTHWVTGGRGRREGSKKAKTTPVPLGIKVCSVRQRRRTPPAFAEWLIEIARMAGWGKR